MGLSELDAALGQASVSQEARTEHSGVGGWREVPLSKGSRAGHYSSCCENHPLPCQACVSSPGRPSAGSKLAWDLRDWLHLLGLLLYGQKPNP